MFFFFSSRRRHTRFKCDWSSDVCSSDLHNASQRAAAIQAAYVILVDLYPKQGDTLMAQRDASVAALASTEKAQSIAAGVAWGQTVADAIWTWRLADGIAPAPPPFLGVQSIVGTQTALV